MSIHVVFFETVPVFYFRKDPKEFPTMQSRILTRFTIIPVFLFTCFLTMDVVAKERELAPILSPDAWQLIAEASAFQQGFIPSQPKQLQLKPRRVKEKRPLVKEPYSRVLVKFANDLQVRLGVHSKPTTKSGRSVQIIRDLLDSVNVTLRRTSHNSVASVEGMLAKARRLSRREQPDLEGIYWLEGEESSVDAAAEMLWTLNEVEYVYYKPVYELQPKRAKVPSPVKKEDRVPNAFSKNNRLQNETVVTGACHTSQYDCETVVTQRECINRGGTFLGPNSICPSTDAKSDEESDARSNALGPLGECCLLTGCTAVVDETGCTDLNGIYLGLNEDEPPDPCGESQTDCPAGLGGGPLFADYDDCAAFGDYISYFTGDCYLDQTMSSSFQPERAQAAPFPIGCCDTDGQINGNGDFIVITGAPTNAGTNVYQDSTCCVDITTEVPYCETNPWGTICANYANSAMFRVDFGGESCLRGAGLNLNPLDAGQPFGPNQAPILVQPRIDMDNLASTLNITNDGTGGTTSARSAIMYFDAASINPPPNYTVPGKYFLGYVNGSWAGGPPTADVDILLDPADTLLTLSAKIALAGAAIGWVASAEGEYNTTAASAVGTQPLTDVFNIDAVIFATTTFGFPPPDGWPTYTRESTTPDFAAMGLMAWMSEVEIPWQFASTAIQPNPLPILPPWEIELIADELRYHQLNQLLSWPMGGAQTGLYTYSPLMASSGNKDNPAAGVNYTGIGMGFGGNGIDLFPQIENPGSFGGGTTQRFSGAYGLGDFWVAENGGVNGAYGNNVKVAVIDWSAHVAPGNMHEDLEHVILEGIETGHDPLTLVFDETENFQRSADHGSAVLGVIGASWGPNSGPGVSAANRLAGNIGAIGMAPDAELYFFPLKSQEHGGRLRDAWENAMSTLEQGDIICAAYRGYGINAVTPNLNFDPIVNDLMQVATDLGICVVIRAGDGDPGVAAVDLLGMVFTDQNAIVATAVTPGTPYKRWADSVRGSNYTGGAQSMTDVAVSGWGTGVVTCGKGPLRTNFLGYYTTLYDDPTDADEVNRRSYTNGFGNTGAAAAQAAGSLAILQGFTKQFYNLPMGPPMARWLLGGGVYGGTDKDGNQRFIARPVDTEVELASDCGQGDSFTWDFCDAPGGGYLTGMFLNPRDSMQNVTTNPIYETPNIDEIIVIRGEHLDGINESLSLIDDNFFTVDPEETEAHSDYPVPGTVPGGSVSYRGTGKTTDIYLSGNFERIPASGTINIDVTHLPSQASRLFSQFYMWDFYQNMWRQAAATAILPIGSTTPGVVTVERANSFVDPATFEFHLRVITQDISSPNGGPNNPWPIYYDRILISEGGLTIPVP